MIKKSRVLLIGVCFLTVFSLLFETAYATNENGNRIIVSMGDSYSSGEGIEPFYYQDLPTEEKILKDDWLAHRSEHSWPGMLELDDKTMAYYRNTNWFFVASSGATSEHIKNEGQIKPVKKIERRYISILESETDIEEETVDNKSRFSLDPQENAIRMPKLEYDTDLEPKVTTSKTYKIEDVTSLDPQIKVFEDYNLKDKVDYVTLTLGGNDAQFEKIVEAGAIDRLDFIDYANLANMLNGVWESFYEDGGIRDDLRQAYIDIHNSAGEEAKIIVAGYPKLFDEDAFNIFSKENKEAINDSVSRFNKEIESIVNSCRAEGMYICFVPVEKEFENHGVDAKDAYLNGVIIGTQSEDLNDDDMFSAYSVHPNKKGADVYFECVQRKINSIEENGVKSEWPDLFGSDNRDVALILDASGSMEGKPIEATKTAAIRFVNTTLHEDVGVGAIIYDNSAQAIASVSKNENYLTRAIQAINAGGGTNIEAGLARAKELFEESAAQKKYMVLMSDGEANEGKVGEALVEYAESLKREGFRIYTLGFFSSLSSKGEAQGLMERIATEGCHYEVDDAEQLVFFFEDIADQMKGTKYYYIRIACPVDVTVSHDGEVLSSKDADKNQRTNFGTMTFEDNLEEYDSSDNRIKTIRLKEGVNYDIKIEGNGTGTMSYTIGFMDEEGEYTDLRNFNNINITQDTKIDTVAAYSDITTIRVDEDGDGKYDYMYKAEKNGNGELFDYAPKVKLLLLPTCILLILIMVAIIINFIKYRLFLAKSTQ